MPGAVQSSLPGTVVDMMRARRRAREADAPSKLRLLRRLHRRFVEGTLPRQTETQAEQSWNEQVFRRVFNYETLFSHDGPVFHLKPKNFTGGAHYDDFSLGFFSSDADIIVASAELKGPLVDLDKRAGDRPSAAEQAREAAGEHGCRWALVSNMRELRLYDVPQETLVCVAYLDAVEDSNDLAVLCAHFDRAALLGDGRKEAELNIAHRPDHPSLPLEVAKGAYRVIGRFSPNQEWAFDLHYVEDALRRAVMGSPSWPWLISTPGTGRAPPMPVEFADGWASVDLTHRDGTRLRASMSLLGHVQVSASCADVTLTENYGKATRGFDVMNAVHTYRLLVSVSQAVYKPYWPVSGGVWGCLSGEVAEASGLGFLAPSGWCLRQASQWGEARTDPVSWGDISWRVDAPQAPVVAQCLCELAIRFRGVSGGVGFAREIVEGHIQGMDERDRPRAEALARDCGF